MSTNAEDAQIYLDCNNYHSSRSNDPNGIVWKTRYANNASYTKIQLKLFLYQKEITLEED